MDHAEEVAEHGILGFVLALGVDNHIVILLNAMKHLLVLLRLRGGWFETHGEALKVLDLVHLEQAVGSGRLVFEELEGVGIKHVLVLSDDLQLKLLEQTSLLVLRVFVHAVEPMAESCRGCLLVKRREHVWDCPGAELEIEGVECLLDETLVLDLHFSIIIISCYKH